MPSPPERRVDLGVGRPCVRVRALLLEEDQPRDDRGAVDVVRPAGAYLGGPRDAPGRRTVEVVEDEVTVVVDVERLGDAVEVAVSDRRAVRAARADETEAPSADRH